MLDCIERQTGERPSASVIWLHGLGADGNDFAPIVRQLALPARAIRFVFPNAPSISVTINGGMVMPAWYDISDTAIRREDERGVRASQGALQALIAREVERGSPSGNIVLAGFSQGGAIALQTALRHHEQLAGILALSTYLPLADKLADEKHAANAAIPIFMAHGTQDPVLPIARAEASRDLLGSMGYRVNWKSYPMAHSVCEAEIADIGAWLTRVLG